MKPTLISTWLHEQPPGQLSARCQSYPKGFHEQMWELTKIREQGGESVPRGDGEKQAAGVL